MCEPGHFTVNSTKAQFKGLQPFKKLEDKTIDLLLYAKNANTNSFDMEYADIEKIMCIDKDI